MAESGLNDVFAAPPSSSSLRAKERMQRRVRAGALEQEIRRTLDFLERRYPEQRIYQRPLASEAGEGRQVEFFDRESDECRFRVVFRFQLEEGVQSSSLMPEVVAESEGVGLLPRDERVRLVRGAGGGGRDGGAVPRRPLCAGRGGLPSRAGAGRQVRGSQEQTARRLLPGGEGAVSFAGACVPACEVEACLSGRVEVPLFSFLFSLLAGTRTMDELEVFRQQIEAQRADLLRMGFREVSVVRLQLQGDEREPLVVVSAEFEGQGVSFYLQPGVVPRLVETLQERPPMYRASNLRILQVMQATLLEQEVARAVSLLEGRYPERRVEHLELPGEGVGRKVEIYDRKGGEMRFWIRFRYQEPEVDIFQVTPEMPEIMAECGSPRQSKPIRTARVRLRGEGAHSVGGVLEVASRFVEAEDAWGRMKERVKRFFR